MKKHAQSSMGFSVIEMLIVVSLVGTLAVLAVNAFQTWQPRLALRYTTQDVASLVNRARIEAIQRSVNTVVEVDLIENHVFAYADVNGDSTVGSPGYSRFLLFDPDPALISVRQTDYEIGRTQLPTAVTFGGPVNGIGGADSVDGLTLSPNQPFSLPMVVFSSRGKIIDPGSIRLIDRTERNVIELAMLGLAGKVSLRKYLYAADSPTAQAGFFEEGNRSGGDRSNIWIWY